MTKAQIQAEVESVKNTLTKEGLIAATSALKTLCSVEPFGRFKEIAEIQYRHALSAGHPNRRTHCILHRMEDQAIYDHANFWTHSILSHLADVASDADQVSTFPTPEELQQSRTPPPHLIILP